MTNANIFDGLISKELVDREKMSVFAGLCVDSYRESGGRTEDREAFAEYALNALANSIRKGETLCGFESDGVRSYLQQHGYNVVLEEAEPAVSNKLRDSDETDTDEKYTLPNGMCEYFCHEHRDEGITPEIVLATITRNGEMSEYEFSQRAVQAHDYAIDKYDRDKTSYSLNYIAFMLNPNLVEYEFAKGRRIPIKRSPAELYNANIELVAALRLINDALNTYANDISMESSEVAPVFADAVVRYMAKVEDRRKMLYDLLIKVLEVDVNEDGMEIAVATHIGNYNHMIDTIDGQEDTLRLLREKNKGLDDILTPLQEYVSRTGTELTQEYVTNLLTYYDIMRWEYEKPTKTAGVDQKIAEMEAENTRLKEENERLKVQVQPKDRGLLSRLIGGG